MKRKGIQTGPSPAAELLDARDLAEPHERLSREVATTADVERLRAMLDYILEFGEEKTIRAVEESLAYAEAHVRSHQHRQDEETSEPKASG